MQEGRAQHNRQVKRKVENKSIERNIPHEITPLESKDKGWVFPLQSLLRSSKLESTWWGPLAQGPKL